MKKIFLPVLCLCGIIFAAKAQDLTYSIEYSQLYIIGSATPYGWDNSATPDMTQISRGVFEWTGELAAGEGNEFKFINTRDWFKHIVATQAGTPIELGKQYRLSFVTGYDIGDKDCKFTVKETGTYTLTVDLTSMCMSVSAAAGTLQLPAELYATGTALGNEVVRLTNCHDAEFKNTLALQRGNLILMDTPQATGQTVYYTPCFDDVDITFGTDYDNKLCTAAAGTSRRGWSVSVAGDYTFYVDMNSGRQSARLFKPVNILYIVGGCCEKAWNYWDKSNNIFVPNPDNEEELIWQGELRIGFELGASGQYEGEEPESFKILTEQSWFGPTLHPYTAGCPLIGGDNDYRITGGDDLKWTIAQDGVYRIVVNTKYETITGELLSELGARSLGSDGDGTTALGHTAVPVAKVCAADRSVRVVSQSAQPVDVRVYDLRGTVIASLAGITDAVVAHNLPCGVYIVAVKNATESETKQVIIR